jgi:hypothetical protein
MPSLSDLLNEVLRRIEPNMKSLLVLVQVNQHFFQAYIPKAYETFVDDQRHKGAGKEEEPGTNFAGGRLMQFFQTVFLFSELAAMTKTLNLMGWTEWKQFFSLECTPLEYTPDSTYLTTPPSPPQAVVFASKTSSFADLILSRFPNLQSLSMLLGPKGNVSQIMMCTRLKKVHLLGHSPFVDTDPGLATPLRTIAALLRLPRLETLSFRFEPNADADDLTAAPLRSTSVRSLIVAESRYGPEHLAPATILPLLSKSGF